MKAIHLIAGATALAMVGCGSQVKLETEEEKNHYALGLMVAEGLGPFKGQLTQEELEPVMRGVEDAARNRDPEVDLSEYLPKVGALSDKFRIRGEEEFLAAAAAEEGAVVLPSGVVYIELAPGAGEEIKRRDWVTLHLPWNPRRRHRIRQHPGARQAREGSSEPDDAGIHQGRQADESGWKRTDHHSTRSGIWKEGSRIDPPELGTRLRDRSPEHRAHAVGDPRNRARGLQKWPCLVPRSALPITIGPDMTWRALPPAPAR